MKNNFYQFLWPSYFFLSITPLPLGLLAGSCISKILYLTGHVFDVAEAQVAQGPGEVLSVERKHCSSSHLGSQELAVQQGILSGARPGKQLDFDRSIY